jgi:hypothetical protein
VEAVVHGLGARVLGDEEGRCWVVDDERVLLCFEILMGRMVSLPSDRVAQLWNGLG